jgi:hypothetical protein
MFAYKRGMFCESKIEMVERESCENVKRVEWKWRAAMATALLPLQQLQVQQEIWELSLSEVILLLHMCCNPFSIYL